MDSSKRSRQPSVGSSSQCHDNPFQDQLTKISRKELYNFDIDEKLLNNFTKINLFNNLIHYIKTKNSEEALFLLDNNKKFLSLCQQTIRGFTPLICACMYQLEDVALAIINTGYSKPGHVTDSNFTALIYAINNNLEKVSYALITNPESNIEHIDGFGNNSLIHACKKRNENIALFIIKHNNEQFNIYQKNNIGKNALMYAVENNLNLVSLELNKIYYPPWIINPI
jgi:ankyrin repeat protein